MRFDCPNCHATLNGVAELASVVVEHLPPAEVSIGERGLCGDLTPPLEREGVVVGVVGD